MREISNLEYRISNGRRRGRAGGLSLVETLISLAITTVLLTAVMVALDASFRAYAASANQASSQSATRMVTERILQLIRTGTVQGPTSTSSGIATSSYMYLLNSKNQFYKIEYKSASQELWLYSWNSIPSNAAIAADTGYASAQPVLSFVKSCTFSLLSRQQNDGTWVLSRGTVDMTIQPPADQTLSNTSTGTAVNALSMEKGLSATTPGTEFRVIASTMPRKLQ